MENIQSLNIQYQVNTLELSIVYPKQKWQLV